MKTTNKRHELTSIINFNQMTFQVLILLPIIHAFKNWIHHREVAEITSSWEGLDTVCLGSFISPKHVITSGICTGGTLKVRTIRHRPNTGYNITDPYQVEKVLHLKRSLTEFIVAN